MSQETPSSDLNRRDFLKAGSAISAGFILSFYIPTLGRREALASQSPTIGSGPNAFIEIKPDNSITLTINHLEMGQGINTSMSQLIAEELECDWKNIRAVSAPANAVYNGPRGMQMTGGSSSLITGYDQYRKIGATMKQMLIQAAAQKWNIAPSECRAENGFIISSKGKLSFGELATEASRLPVPEKVSLKDPKDFKVIGQSMSRVDALDKSTGKAIYGLDIRIPNMVFAVLARPPLPTAKLISFDETAARKIDGVIDVIRFDESVAVLAKDTWTARRGRDSLNPKYDLQGSEKMSSESLFEEFKKSLTEVPGVVVDKRGDVDTAFAKAHKKISATYEFPYLAHATMEPMNCTIHFDGKTAELWSGHQMPTMDQNAAAEILEIPASKVQIHTVYAGGSFGRRGSKNCDYVVEAAKLAKIAKRPLQIVWTREDDMRGGYYRPMNVHQAEIAFDSHHQFLGWKHKISGQSVVGGSPLEKMMVKDGVENVVVEGVANTPYEIPNFLCDLRRPTPNMTTLWWRSVGHSHTAFVTETLIDEIAHETKQDALKMREKLLKNSPRHLSVLNLLAKKSPWGKPAPKGHAYGLAVHESFKSVVGHVVEVSVEKGEVILHHVWSAVDCGQVVNPEGAKTQVQGAFVYGLSAALFGEVVIKNGQVVTSNFHDYPVLRMSQMPKMEVFFVESHGTPTGLGEPGLPAAAPAVANAIFKITGRRLRTLPFAKSMKA
jgi:isoquinoline 1-oxidoreductase beta subunit